MDYIGTVLKNEKAPGNCDKNLRVQFELAKDLLSKCEVVITYLVTAVLLPTGSVELAVYNKEIEEKIDYVLSVYDDKMRLKANPNVAIVDAVFI